MHRDEPFQVRKQLSARISLTASRWMEDPAGTTSPVIFGTDIDGNVYFIEYARDSVVGWVLDWKSFYHEQIVY